MDKLIYQVAKPRTYREWGCSVPFRNSGSVQVRLRNTQNGMESLLPGFSGQKGVYVVSWGDLPTVFALDSADLVLHGMIVGMNASDPATIRQARLKVEAQGHYGPEIAERARTELESDEQAIVKAHFAILYGLLVQGGFDFSKYVSAAGLDPSKEQEIRDIVTKVAERQNMDGEHLWKMLLMIARISAPVGVPPLDQSGRLRKTAQAVDRFRTESTVRVAGDTIEIGQMARTCTGSAEQTCAIANRKLAEIDALTRSPIVLCQNKDHIRDKLARRIEGLNWLLDGWDHLIERWDERKGDLSSRFDLMQELSMNVPLIPSDERFEDSSSPSLQGSSLVLSRKAVKAGENWLARN